MLKYLDVLSAILDNRKMIKKQKKNKYFEEFLLEDLQDPEFAIGYLNETLADDDPRTFLLALKFVIDAQKKDKTAIAKKAQSSLFAKK